MTSRKIVSFVLATLASVSVFVPASTYADYFDVGGWEDSYGDLGGWEDSYSDLGGWEDSYGDLGGWEDPYSDLAAGKILTETSAGGRTHTLTLAVGTVATVMLVAGMADTLMLADILQPTTRALLANATTHHLAVRAITRQVAADGQLQLHVQQAVGTATALQSQFLQVARMYSQLPTLSPLQLL